LTPQADEIDMKVEAIGLNPSDVLSRRGAFDHGFPPYPRERRIIPYTAC
jgi:NADPH:quinone reductase-like Zn-dependent oxidoreductase